MASMCWALSDFWDSWEAVVLDVDGVGAEGCPSGSLGFSFCLPGEVPFFLGGGCGGKVLNSLSSKLFTCARTVA